MNDSISMTKRPKLLGRIYTTEKNDYRRQSSQVHILREELHYGILPIRDESRSHENFEINLSGRDFEVALDILTTIKKENRRNVYKVVSNAVNSLAQSLTYDGFIRYEIVKQDSEFSLHYIPEKSCYDLGFLILQIVPLKQREHINKKVIYLPKNYVWELNFPKAICSRKKYRRILDALAKNTNLIPTEIEHSELYDPSLGFDLLLHSKQSKKYILHILNKIGGVQRDSNLEHITEFYYANRVVRLNLSRTIIREHIICELNMLFRRLKLEAEIKIGGLPTSIEVREILNSLQEGHISIDEALNRTNVF